MHLKRYRIPRFWPLSKKEKKFVVTPMPGPHPKFKCMPLQIILRDVLHYAENSREARKILKSGKILVDKKTRKHAGFPVGLMDVVEIPDAKEYYRVSVNRSGLFLEKISKKESEVKLCRIQGKKTLKNGVQQLNLHDGRNILVEKDTYKTGDSLLIRLPDQKILKHFPLKVSAQALIVAGRNKGVKGTVKKIRERRSMLEKSTVKIMTKDKEIETPKDYVMVGEIRVKE